jgi:hypothetical protein
MILNIHRDSISLILVRVIHIKNVMIVEKTGELKALSLQPKKD